MAFETWQDKLEQARRAAELGRRVLHRMIRSKMFACWKTWLDWHRYGRLAQLEAALEEERKRRQVDIEVCALEMSKLVRSHRDDMAQAQQAWKTERRALE